ncbi:rho GTPase-activating protein 40 isoform X3 [Ambystoma mexicanum]|uniref:rho GTPase-activating protein 40 isoform X3 n=1 Tax=Ambystoma mexicanum TaxID=8296 RepID=UPI0037E7B865
MEPRKLKHRHAFRIPRRCPCKMSRTPRKNSLDSPSSDCSSSSADPLDTLSMDDFWTEVENINQSNDSDPEDGSSPDSKTPEEGETEEEWLQDAGLSNLLTDRTSDCDNYLLLSTLTKTQAAAVQRRLDTYSLSIRKKSKHPVRDVRDVFGGGPCMGIDETVEHSLECTENGLVDEARKAVTETRGPPYFTSPPRGPGAEEEFCMDVAYSEQALAHLKVTGQLENRRITPEGSLPKFGIPKGRLGVTRIGDLSSLDMKKVPTLALIELTALCDILDLDLKRNKAVKRKASENHLFGVPLSLLLENDQKILPNTQVPLILQKMLTCLEKKGLENEGILRISGSQTRIKGLQQKLESHFYAGLFSWEDVHQNDVVGLLKKFIRELPAPLLTTEYLSAFAAVQDIPDLRQRLQALNLLILILPESNRNTLKVLLEFLRKVVAQEKKNKMNLWNVSTVMAPNLFMHRGVSSKIPEGKEKQLAEGAADVVRLMIHYQDLLWTISSFLVAQVRKLNESSARRYQFCDRRIKNLLRKIHTDKDRPEKKQAEPSKTVKIQASLFLKDTLEVPLNNGIRAADVLSMFQKYLCQRSCNLVNMVGLLKFNGSIDSPNLLLYEVGGNISEHCLDPDTYLLDLYNINPTGEWIIKQSPSLPPVL